jgi:hypothetical protein
VSCTGGHRGLTGVCMAHVDSIIADNQPVSMAAWAERERRLPFLLGSGGIGTYSALVHDLVKIQEEDGVQDIMQQMLHNAGRPWQMHGPRVGPHIFTWAALCFSPTILTNWIGCILLVR